MVKELQSITTTIKAPQHFIPRRATAITTILPQTTLQPTPHPSNNAQRNTPARHQMNKQQQYQPPHLVDPTPIPTTLIKASTTANNSPHKQVSRQTQMTRGLIIPTMTPQHLALVVSFAEHLISSKESNRRAVRKEVHQPTPTQSCPHRASPSTHSNPAPKTHLIMPQQSQCSWGVRSKSMYPPPPTTTTSMARTALKPPTSPHQTSPRQPTSNPDNQWILCALPECGWTPQHVTSQIRGVILRASMVWPHNPLV